MFLLDPTKLSFLKNPNSHFYPSVSMIRYNFRKTLLRDFVKISEVLIVGPNTTDIFEHNMNFP